MSNTLSKRFSLLVVLNTFLVTTGGLHAQHAHKLESNAYVKEFRVFWPNLRQVIEVVDRYMTE